LKNLLKILILTLILASCKKETEQKAELEKSEFNLKTDLTDFKNKMTELDTLKIWFNHSVCTYQGAERIEITKESDSIKIRTEFKEDTFEENPEWKVIYEKRMSINDTIWKIEEFFKRNVERKKSEEKEFGTLQISHNGNKTHFFTNGLIDLQDFIVDYNLTMKALYPKNVEIYYNLEVPKLNENIKIIETEMEPN
jgi:hypothetical protein